VYDESTQGSSNARAEGCLYVTPPRNDTNLIEQREIMLVKMTISDMSILCPSLSTRSLYVVCMVASSVFHDLHAS